MKKPKTKLAPSSIGKTSGGRDSNGRFTIGNRLSRGGAPLAARSCSLRAALLAAVSPGDIAEIAAKLLQRAKRGDVKAAREILNRCIGKPSIVADREPLQVAILAENVIADAMENSRLIRIRHARGENLDTEAPPLPIKDRVAVEANPAKEIQRVKVAARRVLED